MAAELRVLEEAAPIVAGVAKSTSLLNRIQWSRRTEQAFFDGKADALPDPTYKIDVEKTQSNVTALLELRGKLEGDSPVLGLLRDTAESYLNANEMMLSVGTPRFYQLSLECFGGAATMALDADTTNLDLARHIGKRIGNALVSAETDCSERFDHDVFIAKIGTRLRSELPEMQVEIVADEEMSAKVLASAKRVRVRRGATFTAAEVESLYVHEIETHVLTGQNGAAQKSLPFLHSGGPRSTRTQEGLAVFAELYSRSLSIRRLGRLVRRVELVGMAEHGASFIDVYRHLVGDHDYSPHDAYLDAMRIFRGGVLEGGGPFTKDACYLSGLAEVYNFLRVTMSHGAREVAEVLVSGRMCIDDVDELVELRRMGILQPPKFLPFWLRNWDSLLAYFGFTSFLNEIDLPPVERRFAEVRRLTSR